MANTSYQITTKQIIALQAESGKAGDTALVNYCSIALHGADDEISEAKVEYAREQICDALNDAAANDDTPADLDKLTRAATSFHTFADFKRHVEAGYVPTLCESDESQLAIGCELEDRAHKVFWLP